MNPNNFDPSHILQLQRLLAAQASQSAQRGIDAPVAAPPLSGNNALLEQILMNNIQERYPALPQPSPFDLISSQISPQLFQASMLMNNGRVNAERDRLLAERILQERLLVAQAQQQQQNERNLLLAQQQQQLQLQLQQQLLPLQQQLQQNERLFFGGDLSLKNELSLKRQFQEEAFDQGAGVTAPNPNSTADEDHGDLSFEQDDDLSEERKPPAVTSSASEPSKKEKGKQSVKARSTKKKQDTKWLISYEELKEYRTEYGDCIVPRGFPPNPRLASWVAEQRKQYKLHKDGKNSSITLQRIELLEEIDFAWNAQEAAWERHIDDLQNFKEEYGDCLVPLNHPKYPKLGLWVKEQRRHYTLMKQGKPSHMTEQRARVLDEVGFCWDTHEVSHPSTSHITWVLHPKSSALIAGIAFFEKAVWGERLRELCQYKATHGDCIVPTNYTPNPKLGTWVHHQRRQYKKYREGKTCHITEERIKALESIGFVWYPRERGKSFIEENSESSGSETDSDASLNDDDLRPIKRRRSS
jgi:hypothetical protein